MIELFRIMGFLLLCSGGLVIATWLIEPLRKLWPLLLALPLPVLIGVAVGSFGLILLLASLIWERMKERDADSKLREEI